MAQYFFDTSALAKYYHTEAGSKEVLDIFGEPGCIVRVSSLGILEAQSVFAMKVRSHETSEEAGLKQRALLMADVASGRLLVHELRDEHFASAAKLIERHGFNRQIRTLDALQLAVALELAQRKFIDMFVLSDKRLADVAQLEGLTVVNPV